METYIALLLMIVPGFIARKVYRSLTIATKIGTDFNETILSLVFSIFILLADYICINLMGVTNANSLNSLVKLFSSTMFISFYITITVINSIYIGYIWSILCPIYFSLINAVRKYSGKTELINAPSLLATLSDGKNHLLKIQDGKNIRIGFLNMLENNSGNIDSLSLKGEEEVKKYITALNIKNTYISMTNSNANVVEYDIDEFDKTEVKKTSLPLFFIGSIITGILLLIVWAFSKFIFHLF